MGMFDWVSFENGKARFCGGVGGADDAPHEVLGVKLGDLAYYGDFETKFATETSFPCHVRFAPVSDQIADIA